MKYKINLAEIPLTSTEILGTDMAIVNKENNTVYITSKPYMDKLFRLTGYKNLNVIKILEEYAGKTISSVGDLDPYKIYIDTVTDSFVIANQISIDWVNAMMKFLEEGKFTIVSTRRYDTFYYWDQIIIENQLGSRYVIYLGLYDEMVRVYSVQYNSEGVLIGLVNEGKFKFNNGQESFDEFKLTVSRKVNISSYFNLNMSLSIYEYVGVLKQLGYVSSRRGKIYREEKADNVLDIVGDIDSIIDEYNSLSWIQRRVKTSKSFYDGCVLVTRGTDSLECFVDEFASYYDNNQSETSDLFLL